MTGDLFGGGMKRGATFSPCRRYRYVLWRTWSDAPPLVVIGLNPSTADEETNDPTITRCQTRAEQLGMGGLVMLNLFAWRSTDPKGLTRDTWSPAQEPDTEHNDKALLDYTASGLVLCAWGNHGWINGRASIVRENLTDHGRDLYALMINKKSGQPKHPLYVSYDVKPKLWIARRNSSGISNSSGKDADVRVVGKEKGA